MSIFEKTLYQTHSPFYSDLSRIMRNTCSQFVIETIQAYREELDKKRLKETEVRLILIISDMKNSMEKANVVKCFYERYWDIDIIISSAFDVESVLRPDKTNVLFPYNRIIPLVDMRILLDCLKEKGNTFYEFKMKVWQMDSLGSHVFSKILNNDYLEENRGKTICLSSMEYLPIIYPSGIECKISKELIVNVYGL